MKIKEVKELMPYSSYDLMGIMETDEETINMIIDNLVKSNVLKRINRNIPNIELQQLLEIDSYDEVESYIGNDIYVFQYVGMVMVKDYCFFVYPKYIEDIKEDVFNGYKKFRQILDVIRKYESKVMIQSFGKKGPSIEYNMLSYTLDLIADYNENGFYRNDEQIIEDDGSGEILWDKTINEKNAYFSRGYPIYLSVFTLNNELNEDNLFRRLHACILTITSRKIAPILKLIGIAPIIISDDQIDSFGSSDYLIYQLEQELARQFVTSRQEILSKMIAFIKQDNVGKDGTSFVGTSNFKRVWEDVCSTVEGNSLKMTLNELGLKGYDGISDSVMLKDLIPKPKWRHFASDAKHTVNYTLIPDLVSVRDGKLSIYDAKYYKIVLNEEEIKHQPGIGDITKQYLYELAYQRLANENNIDININAFLMPYDSKSEKKLGVVSLSLFSKYNMNNKLNDIDIILKPCELVFEKYLKY